LQRRLAKASVVIYAGMQAPIRFAKIERSLAREFTDQAVPRMDLFDTTVGSLRDRPLADRMRPVDLDELLGQSALIGAGKILRKAIEEDRLFSMLFWGPPGTGKTSLAKILAVRSRSRFVPYSAVTVGVKEIRELAARAQEDLKYSGVRTILFLDEIHRFNKAQQDYLLPYVESGILILIGATTENPSFEVNSALLSRLRVFVLEALPPEALREIVHRALRDKERGLGTLELEVTSRAEDLVVSLADGDARSALNILEVAAAEAHRREDRTIDLEIVREAAQRRSLLYDKAGEEHFNLISALHKSLRDSDPDAGLYWMGRMIEGGEDPLYIARRLLRFASEDVGLASPKALEQAVAAFQACRFVGLPECALALAQVVVFLAASPKSNSLYTAYSAVKEEIARSGHLPVPLHIRNAPTRFMKDLGYGKGSRYAHDFPDATVDQEHLPEPLRGKRFYHPSDRGYEQNIQEWMEKKKSNETAGQDVSSQDAETPEKADEAN
jgi:putative ATPase